MLGPGAVSVTKRITNSRTSQFTNSIRLVAQISGGLFTNSIRLVAQISGGIFINSIRLVAQISGRLAADY